MRVGELSDDICNHLCPEVTMKVIISKAPLCFFIALNRFNNSITDATPEMDTINSKLDLQLACGI
jgi:hypothetical protein